MKFFQDGLARCILVLITAVASVALASCRDNASPHSRENAFSRIMDTKKIGVGYIVFPPTITKDPNTGELGGHFVQTLKEIARQAGWQAEFIETDWSGFVAGLNGGRFDLCIAPTFVTIPRAMSVSFTRPLFFAGNSAIVRKGETRFTDIASFDQNGVTISVTQGEAGYEYAKTNFKLGKLRVLPGPDQSLTFQDVASGRADAALGDAYVTARFAAANPEVQDHFKNHPYNLTPVSWAMRLGEVELLSFINDALQALDSQGKLLQYEKDAGTNWLHLDRSYSLTTDRDK